MNNLKRGLALMLTASLMLSMAAGCGNKTEEMPEAVADTQEEEQPAETVNLIPGGSFDGTTNPFYIYCEGGEVTTSCNEKNELQCDIVNLGEVAHGVQIYVDGFKLTQGVKYEFSCDIYSTIDRSVDWRFQINGGDYHAYAGGKIATTAEPLHVVEDFTMNEATDPCPRFCFNMGYVDEFKEAGIQSTSIENHSVMIDNVSLIILDDSNAVAEEGEKDMNKIRINQVGYQTKATKYAVFADLEPEIKNFFVVDASSGNSVFEGRISEAVNSASSGEANSVGYFTDITTPGTYKIVAGENESYEFVISDDAFDDAFRDICKMLYLQRCGCELTKEDAGDFAHGVCHSTPAVIYGTDKTMDASGGWHDAGDYGRYVVSGAQTVADLFLAYEFNPKMFDDHGVDILGEAKYEMDWLLKMQDPQTGGVYHKVTCASFPAMVMPEEETEQLIVAPISNTATGDFAAIMAWGSEVYRKTDAAYAKKCLEASKKAFAYLDEHQRDPGYTNPSEITTGEYPDGNCFDEMLWAAVELYRVTGDEKYYTAIEAASKKVGNYVALGWTDMGGFAAYRALSHDKLTKDHKEFADTLSGKFFKQVDEVVATAKKSTYMINRDMNFEWGSNMGIANDGMILLMANALKANNDYKVYANTMMNYLYGTNATDYSYITAHGTNTPQNPHHRPSVAQKKAMPGMLIGGPDNGLHDPCAVAMLTDKAPMKCYVDNDQSYSTNEICVYWNSPLIALMAMNLE